VRYVISGFFLVDKILVIIFLVVIFLVVTLVNEEYIQGMGILDSFPGRG